MRKRGESSTSPNRRNHTNPEPHLEQDRASSTHAPGDGTAPNHAADLAAGWTENESPLKRRIADHAACWLVAVALAAAMWWSVASGGGLQGGDLYSYYFPLKSWYAERLQAGELPLWNPRVGHGFPTVGESQTGVFYPFNLLAYGLLPLHAAYHVNFLLHYVLAFGFTTQYARQIGLGVAAAVLAGIVFVYGWFPARSCLEWAIVTGAWLPLALSGTEGYLADRRLRHLVVVQFALLMQLLAGHYHLSFVTLLLLACYVPIRLATSRHSKTAPAFCPGRTMAMLGVSVGLAFGMAAIQLLPTLELKSRSQRASDEFRRQQVSYGSVPVEYLPQAVMPWRYYPHVDEPGFADEHFGRRYTNKVEAHLYFGILSLLLGAVGAARVGRVRALWSWVVVAICGMLLVTGWWSRFAAWLPGFNYFTGPGRYGLMVQLAVAVFAAQGTQSILEFMGARSGWRTVFTAFVFVAVWFDLAWVARRVQIAHVVDDPPIKRQAQSIAASLLRDGDRLVSRNQNAISLCGTATLPVYLGIGPREYFGGELSLPASFQWGQPATSQALDWFTWSGVTHFLAFEPMPTDWPVRLEWWGHDPFLHALLGRDPRDPLWLYRFESARGRAFWVPQAQSTVALGHADVRSVKTRPISDLQIAANEVRITLDADQDATVILSDLLYPGWEVEVDGRGATPVRNTVWRAVFIPPGRHVVRWVYRPNSVVLGAAVSGVSLAMAVAMMTSASRRRGSP